MSDIILDYQVKENCYNLYESYGEICVKCGCCSDDPESRFKSRIELADRRLEELESFITGGDADLISSLQRKNSQRSIKFWKKEKTKYQKLLNRIQKGK